MPVVTQSGLGDAVAEATRMNKAQGRAAVDAMVGTIIALMRSGQEVRLIGFGTLSAPIVPEHQGRNPITGGAVTVPARRVPKFKASAKLRDALNA